MDDRVNTSPPFSDWQFNCQLFDEYGIAVAGYSPNGSSIDLQVIGVCGAVSVPKTSDWLAGSANDVHARLLAEIPTARWYSQYLEDVDFGFFRKSDLFHALITTLILPTQLANGPE